MTGLGTIVNCGAIVAGGLIGILFGKFFKERYQETIIKGVGFANIVMALGSVMSQMLVVRLPGEFGTADPFLETQGVMMMIISIALGCLIGEFINLDRWMNELGCWLREKTGSSSDKRFVDGFVYASITVCVGAMAIMGSIEDGIYGNHEILFTKALLDFAIIIVMTSSMGKGCLFSAIPVGVFQGAVTALAGLIAPIMTTTATSNMSLVGNVLIMCIGVNLVWPNTIRVANMLPAIVIAVAFPAIVI